MNLLEMITIPFFFSNSQNVSLRPAHSSNTLFPQSSGRHPLKLSHVNFYCNILGQGVKKYQVSSLLVFYDTSWKTVGLSKMRQSLFLHFEEHRNNFCKINLLSTAPPNQHVSKYNKIIIVLFLELKKKQQKKEKPKKKKKNPTISRHI